ncbi:hypothetical protein [Aquisphaera insulae]|uniref:hypothetical protein n=1 Tax=Aquisphaera insulae TaxID=2712864 RepID=UPI0013EA1AFF|nr:hypothetical protein [Aquisphaera insulae]
MPIEPLPDDFLSAIEGEILAGLPNEQGRREVCLRSAAYYALRGVDMIPHREAEDDADYRRRPKRSLPFARRVVTVLASQLYAPAPARSLPGHEGAADWLNAAYDAAQVNGVWQQVDRMSHLHGMAAIQVAATGDPARPLSFQVWSGWHEIVPYEAPWKANEVACCVTIDCADNRTRYTFWTPEFFRVYETDQLRPGQTAGGRLPRFRPELSGQNPYGVLPFAFAWFEPPTSGIDACGGLGPFLSAINSTLDVEASDLAQAVQEYHAPMGVAFDVDVAANPVRVMGRFARLASLPTDLEKSPPGRLEYLQADLDIEGGWTNIRSVIDSELEGLGVPVTSYRMGSKPLASGAALAIEQKPLADYATERRQPFRRYERDLAVASLAVGGTHYDRADLLAAAKEGRLSLAWPGAQVDLPGPERDAQDRAAIELGIESPVTIAMRRYGLTREQAIAHLAQVAADPGLVREAAARLGVPTPPAVDPVQTNGG